MIGRVAIALISIAAPASLALGYWQGQSSELDVPMLPRPISAPVVAKPGEGAADAVRYLASINVDTRSAAPAASPKVEAGPLQPDIAVQFRRDVTAVLTGDEPHVVLSGGKQLGAGEIYRDGWKIRDLSGQRATLTKGSERRDVDLFSAPPMQAQVASSGAPLLTGPIELTNGMSADQRNAALQAQRSAMMQMLQQQMQGILPPGAQIRPNGAFGGPPGAGGGFAQFRPGGGSGRDGRQGGDAPPRGPATTPDSGNRQPD